MLRRCSWVNEAMIDYHDNEWGVFVEDDNKLFEYMLLEIFEPGLNWQIIFNKRENFRQAFDNFNINKIAKYDANKLRSLLKNKNIIRNKKKIESIIFNAKSILSIKKEHDSFHNYLESLKNKEEDYIYKEFKSRFKFMGPEVTKMFLQNIALIQGAHEKNCYKNSL